MPSLVPRISVPILLTLVFLSSPFTYGQQPTHVDEDHTKWIAGVIQAVQTIKPGMTRGDLQRLFEEEGGLSSRKQRKYVYKRCPYIKVDVTFAPVDQDPYNEKAADKITRISQPYLEYTIMD
jgi:hypothetical protein